MPVGFQFSEVNLLMCKKTQLDHPQLGGWGDGGPRSTSFEATALKLWPEMICFCFFSTEAASSIHRPRDRNKRARELIIGVDGRRRAAPDEF